MINVFKNKNDQIIAANNMKYVAVDSNNNNNKKTIRYVQTLWVD